MTHPLVEMLHKAGVPCRELTAWTSCERGGVDRCDVCGLDGPELCDAQVVSALAKRLAKLAVAQDEVLRQRDHWKGITDRLADKFMEGESCRPSAQKRHF